MIINLIKKFNNSFIIALCDDKYDNITKILEKNHITNTIIKYDTLNPVAINTQKRFSEKIKNLYDFILCYLEKKLDKIDKNEKLNKDQKKDKINKAIAKCNNCIKQMNPIIQEIIKLIKLDEKLNNNPDSLDFESINLEDKINKDINNIQSELSSVGGKISLFFQQIIFSIFG